MDMTCIRCGGKLKTKSKKYCSPRCAKLFLQKRYREKHKDAIRDYKREWKKRGVRGSPATNNILSNYLKRNQRCAKCGVTDNLHVCHVKPRACGGRNLDNLIVLCQKHHYEFDKALVNFWESSS